MVADHLNVPFQWAVNDCCTFAGKCVEAVTGDDPMAKVNYTTKTGALRVIKAGGGLAAMVAERLGEEIPPLMAQPGDVGLFIRPDDGLEGLAVNIGDWHCPTHDGLQMLRPEAIQRAWRAC